MSGQNTTFGGIQGFSRPPSTPWFDDEGAFAGVVHQERNWTYVLVKGAGHLVPQQQPERVRVGSPFLSLLAPLPSLSLSPTSPIRSISPISPSSSTRKLTVPAPQAFVLLREFILGANTTGLVTNTSGTVAVVGGENATLAGAYLRGQDAVFVGSGTTQGSTVYPSATIAAWDGFIASVDAGANVTAGFSGGVVSGGGPQATQGSGAGRVAGGGAALWVAVAGVIGVVFA